MSGRGGVGAAGGEATVGVLADVDPAVAYPATVPEMGESGLHSQVRIQTYLALRDHFAGRAGCFVCTDRNVYYRPVPEVAFVVPDVFVSFGVDPGALELDFSYRIWDAGAPPRFVLEVASERTYRNDLDDKPGVYLEMGAEEYWRFDPTGGEFFAPMLQGDRRAGGAWEPIGTDREGGGLVGRSEALGLDLRAEARRLRLRDPQTGLWLPDHDDTRRERDAAQARATAAEDRATAAEAEVAALRTRLNDRDGEKARQRRTDSGEPPEPRAPASAGDST